MTDINLLSLPAFSDNYIHVIKNAATNEAAVVDPGDPKVVLNFLKKHQLTLTDILITHHHPDHTGGITQLKAATNAHVWGPVYENIEGIDTHLKEGDALTLYNQLAQIFFTPGHTSGHICYYFPNLNAAFTGDTLFSFGCGRLFEGTPQQMWESLKKLRNLPKNTRIFSAHEYTLSNLNFAVSLEPNDEELNKIYQEYLQKPLPTVPTLLAQEKRFNPFLRCDDPAFKKAIGLENDDPSTVFKIIRQKKDSF